jgi:polyisoprenyl-phosphate glycosyltransferase
MKATAIVPAYNEASRIASVLSVLTATGSLGEIIVVDDGSKDNTTEVASTFPEVRVVRLPQNLGKAGAMTEGARRARHEVVVFLDADLIGLTPAHVESLLAPVMAEEADMTVGQFWSGSPLVTIWMRFCPAISGQRAMRVGDFLDIPDIATSGFGVEVVVTRAAIRRHLRVRYVPWSNVTHVLKESKRGIARGLATRVVMYAQILRCTAEDRYHHLRDLVRSRV